MSQSQSQQDNDDLEENPIEVKKELKSSVLKSALKSFILSHVTSHYEVAAVRTLIKEKSDIWIVRRRLEENLANQNHVVGFISCLTALKTKDQEEPIPGISFWVIFDWPEYGIQGYENHLTKIFLKEEVELYSCKAVRGRSKLKHYIIFYRQAFWNCITQIQRDNPQLSHIPQAST